MTTSTDTWSFDNEKKGKGICGCFKKRKKKLENSDEDADCLSISSRILQTFDPLLSYKPKVWPRKLVFKEIQANLVQKGQEVKILKNIAGVCKPGQLTFIMGPSGVGKTTLLNILTGRSLEHIQSKGNVFVNGRYMDPSEMKKISAYVEKDDYFIEELTVRETIRFAARMRSVKFLKESELDKVVDEMIFVMGLEACQNSRVGSKTSGSGCLSRGERKKLAFACEILNDPPILFCDEPTSGLDFFMASQIMKVLKQLANEGKTIVCSVHTPSTTVFDLADSLILLAQGEIVYNGPARSAIRFFGKCRYISSKFVNSPENLMNFISQAYDETDEEYDERVQVMISDFAAVSLKPEFSLCSNRSSSRRVRDEGDDEEYVKKMNREWNQQVWYVTLRDLKMMKRKKFEMMWKIVQTITISIIIGSMYHGTEIHAEHLESFRGFAYGSLFMVDCLFLIPSAYIFHRDYPIIIREYNSNLYDPFAYFIAKSTIETVQYSIFPLIFGTITISMMSLPISFRAISNYFAITFLIAVNDISAAHAIAAIFINPVVTITVLLAMKLPFMTLSGFYISFDEIPIWLKPFSFVSLYRRGFEVITVAYFQDVEEIPGCHQNLTLKCSTGRNFIDSQSFLPFLVPIDYGIIVLVTIFWKIVGIFGFRWRIDRNS